MRRSLDLLSKGGIRIGADELDHLQVDLWKSFIDFVKSSRSFGIISHLDPMSENSTSLKLSIKDEMLQVDPGTALLEDGTLVNLKETASFSVPSMECLVVITYTSELSGYQRTLFAQEHEPLITRMCKIDLIDLTQYEEYCRSNVHEVLGLISSKKLTYFLGGKPLRRWSNQYDWIHRSKLGLGMVSDFNPHGTTIFDMAFSSGKGLWSTLGSDGFFMGTTSEYQNMKYLGDILEVSIHRSEWSEIDGVFQYKPQFAPRTFVFLSSDKDASEVPFTETIVNSSKVICLDKEPPEKSTLVMTLCSTYNFRIDRDNIYSLTGLQINPNDQLIHKGSPLREKHPLAINFAELARYEQKDVQLFVDTSGNVNIFPKPLPQAYSLNTLSTQPLKLQHAFSEPTKIRLILADNTAKESFNLKLKLTGKDDNNLEISDLLEFSSDWKPVASLNFKDSSKKFKSLQTISLVSSVGSDITTTFKLFELTQFDGLKLGTLDILVNGLQNYRDSRLLNATPLNKESNNSKIYFSDPYLLNPFNSDDLSEGVLLPSYKVSSRLLKFSRDTILQLVTKDTLFNPKHIITWTDSEGNILKGEDALIIPKDSLGYFTLISTVICSGFTLTPKF